ncbi:MAG: GNAT family N-acetyltransferase [Nitrososphaerota archaeon]|nr:GNAT family N-acetyltransferase [Nitrososphaerota archaeon]MDG7014263.1 GNAT family N-acetyltransferase [Nitrososphaerota archaeon]MDG7026435.1 GNAT family N-acetyltransferase [Nitrososphaerota archaeon]
MLTVAELSEDRWQDFRELRLEALMHEPAAFGSSYEEERDMPEGEWRRRMGTMLFALEDGIPVGMISYSVSTRLKTKHVAHIHSVYVRPSARRKGGGALLLKKALDKIREHEGVVKVQLSVNPAMGAAVSLYERGGFVSRMRSEKELLVDGKYHDLLYMEKML